MNSALEQWIASCARSPGALGCSVQLPDRTCVSRSFNEDFPQRHLDEALRCLAEFAPVLSGHGLFPRSFTWSFIQGQVRVVARPDGALLALILQPGSAVTQNLDALTGEFFGLKLSD